MRRWGFGEDRAGYPTTEAARASLNNTVWSAVLRDIENVEVKFFFSVERGVEKHVK